MDELLIEFVNTFDLLLKRVQKEVENSSGISKLTISQFQYLDAIHQLGEPTITEISERLHITKASVTTGINKLVSLGYVIKTRSTTDKRSCHVGLTASSQNLVVVKYQALKEYGEQIHSALTADENSQFENSLRKIVTLFTHTKR